MGQDVLSLVLRWQPPLPSDPHLSEQVCFHLSYRKPLIPISNHLYSLLCQSSIPLCPRTSHG